MFVCQQERLGADVRAISLFSGVGGFEIGFERAGIETVLQAERDQWALEVLARHWPETERVTDVRDVQAVPSDSDEFLQQLRSRHGSIHVDLVYGGFPCQDLSVAGKRAGLGGERSGLGFEFHRVLRELRPRWAVIENVPGLLSSNGGCDFGVILDGLDDLGFDVAWAVLDARHFGVPQRRRRVFVVAGPSRRGVEQVLSLCEGCGGNPETGFEAGEGTTGALSAGTLRAGGVNAGNNPGGGYLGDVAFALTDRGRPGESQLEIERSGRAPEVDGGHYLTIPQIVGALSDGTHHGGGTNGQDAYTGRVFPAVGGVRRLTPLECERLMGWPDDWTRWTAGGKEIADSHRYRMAGNGVVASVAEWIGHRIVAVDGGLA